MNNERQEFESDDAWLTRGSPFPKSRQQAPQEKDDIVTYLLTNHLRLLVILGILSFFALGYVSFEKGRMDAEYDRQHGISRY